jgi:hypothetical protein
MLFRSATGDMVIVNKYDYKNDELYYKKIKNIKFGKNDALNIAITDANVQNNYSNLLIDNLLERTRNNFENQE